jgi:carbonyl reductase 1
VFLKVYLEDFESMRNAIHTIQDTYGKCDILVNNAAVCFNDPTIYGRVSHTSFAEQAEITIRTNFQGTLALTRGLLPILLKSKSPRIINIASTAGRLTILPTEKRREEFASNTLTLEELEGYMSQFILDAKNGSHLSNDWPNTSYGVSKVGIIAMTRIIARENPEIMVNSVDPGYCRTDQNNNKGFVSPERGALTPFLLAVLSNDQFYSGLHWYEEKVINWTYQYENNLFPCRLSFTNGNRKSKTSCPEMSRKRKTIIENFDHKSYYLLLNIHTFIQCLYYIYLIDSKLNSFFRYV